MESRKRYRSHATAPRCLLLVCTARMSLCSDVTACNYHAWFGDLGLVTTLIRDQTQVPYNASQVWYPCAMFQRCCRHVGTALQAGSTDFVFRLFDCICAARLPLQLRRTAVCTAQWQCSDRKLKPQ